MVKIKKIILLLFIILISSSLGKSFEFESIVKQNIVCNIDYNNKVYENISILVKVDNQTDRLFYYIPHKLLNIKVNSSIKYKDLTIYYNGGYTKIELEFNNTLKKGSLISINISGLGKDIIWERDDNYQFIISYLVSGDTNLTVLLPPGYILTDNIITPSNYYITGNGRNQIIRWEFINQNPSIVTFSFKYRYAGFSNISYTNTNNKKYDILLIALFLASLILFIATLKLFKDKKRRDEEINKLYKELENKKKEIEELKNELSDYEKEINNLKNELIKKNEILNIINENNKRYEEERVKLIREINNLKKENENLNNLLDKYKEENQKLKSRVLELEDEIKRYLSSKCEMLWNFLTDEEKKIIELIREYGSITQKELVELTGMSKPKVSRIVSELEDRGIIKKEKIGRINKLALSDEVKKML
ncbi:DUF7343 domain-containing protein [Methanocaldococcus sp.]